MERRKQVMKTRMIAIVTAIMLVVGEFSMLGIKGLANPNIILGNSLESVVLDNNISENVSNNDVSGNDTLGNVSDNNVSGNDISENVTDDSVSDNDILENVSDNNISGNDIQENVSENNIPDSISDNDVSGNDIRENVSNNNISGNEIPGNVLDNNIPSNDISGNSISNNDVSGNGIFVENTVLNEQIATEGDSSSAAAALEEDLTKVPSRPELGYGTANNQKIQVAQATVSLTMKAGSKCKIYYTLDGTNPTFKKGLPSANATLYSKAIKVGNKSKVVVKAIAVNAAGLSSPVTTHTFTFKPEATKIELSALGSIATTNKNTGKEQISVNLVKGKSLQLSTSYTPDYAVNKQLTWEIVSEPNNAGNEVKISNKGKITTTKKAVEGTYQVRASLKSNTDVRATILVNVKKEADIKTLKVINKKITLTTNGKTSDTYNLFKALDIDATTEMKATNFTWKSSDISVATVNKEGVVESVIGQKGKAVITATAKDGSGKQAKFTITVKQLATKVTISGENKLGIGKSITLKATVEPVSATSQKVRWEIAKYPDKANTSQVKINANGKLTASKNATAGSYTIKATALDGSNKSVTYAVTIQSAVQFVEMASEDFTLYRVSGGDSIDATVSKNINVTCTTMEGKNSTNLEVQNTAPGIVKATYDTSKKRVSISATGAGTGIATITVMATDGSKKKDTLKVTVVNPPSSITIQLPNESTGDLAINHNHKPKVILGTKYGKPGKVKVNWSLAKANENVVLNSSTGSLKIKNTASAGDTFTLKVSVIGELTLNSKIACTARTKMKKIELYLAGGKMQGEPIVYDDEAKNIEVKVQQRGTSEMVPINLSVVTTTKNISVKVNSDGLKLTYDKKKGTGKIQCVEPGKYTLTIKALDGTGISRTYKIRGMKKGVDKV